MKFVNHDALAGNIFNLDHCSSSPSQVTWLQCVTGMTADCRACLMRACQVPWSRHVTNDLRLLDGKGLACDHCKDAAAMESQGGSVSADRSLRVVGHAHVLCWAHGILVGGPGKLRRTCSVLAASSCTVWMFSRPPFQATSCSRRCQRSMGSCWCNH